MRSRGRGRGSYDADQTTPQIRSGELLFPTLESPSYDDIVRKGVVLNVKKGT
jgi:hypothetical protein